MKRGNRRALIERGDADISVDLPNKDFAELKQAGKVAVVTNLIGNGIGYIGMNCKKEPFGRPAEPGRGGDCHVPADARPARRPGRLLRRPRRHQGGDR